MSDDIIGRLTRIAVKTAKGRGAKAAIYANAHCFDVFCEKFHRKTGQTGVYWVKLKTGDAFLNPRKTALRIRQEIKDVFE